MKRVIPIVIFVIGQLASVAILVLWIVSHAKSPVNVWWLLDGIFLMIAVILGSTLLFIFWTKSRMLDTERANFIASVSHELLTPLASLHLYLETMKMRDVDEARREEFLDLMLEDAQRLSSLINQIMDASRLERGKSLFKFQVEDLGEMIENYLGSNQPWLEGAKLEVELEDECLAMTDGDAFNMILKNLLHNAVRYSPEPALIKVVLKKQANKILLQVTDQGEGLESKASKKIFKPFYRASRKKGGAGLGLFIVSMVVRAHKGKVWASSAGQGHGTRMSILLPAAPANGSSNRED